MGRRAANKWRRRNHRSGRRRTSLRASNWGPVLALLGTVLGVVGVVYLVVFVALPRFLPLLGIDYSGPGAPTPTPRATIAPTPTPHPMEAYDPASAANEVVFDGYTDYRWFGDPYFYKGSMLLSGGKLVDGNAVMGTLLLYRPADRTADTLPLTPQYAHFMYAKFNDKWITYLDAKLDGGGAIMAVNRTAGAFKPVKVKDIYTGQPEVMLDGDYIAWIDRTGTRMDKLFVCDLNTMETTTLSMFSGSVYGESLPCLRAGTLYWADTDSGAGDASSIHSISLAESTSHAYSPGTYAHDPQGDGTYLIWLDAHHAEDATLYYCKNNGVPVPIDKGVFTAYLGDGFVAYSKAESIYAYMFENGKTYRLAPEHEADMLLGVSDAKAIWMDVTSRERDIVKFAEVLR